MKDKNGQSVEKFYARSRNSSQEIPMSEMSSYFKERFKQMSGFSETVVEDVPLEWLSSLGFTSIKRTHLKRP